MSKLTPTEIKAKAKAKEIYESVLEIFLPIGYEAKNVLVLEICNYHLDESIKYLNEVKGMGKIHRVKFLKLVKKYLEDE